MTKKYSTKNSSENSDSEPEEIVYKDEDFEVFKYAPKYALTHPDKGTVLVKNIKTGRILKPQYAGQHGQYIKYNLRKDGKSIGLCLHQILAIQYKGHMPGEDGMVVDHIDRNPHNNSLDNIRLVTPSENSKNRNPYKKGKNKYIPKLPPGKRYQLIKFKDDPVVGIYYRIGKQFYKVEKGENNYLELACSDGDNCFKVKCVTKQHSFVAFSPRLVVEEVIEANPAEPSTVEANKDD
jgi:hypothetical protein